MALAMQGANSKRWLMAGALAAAVAWPGPSRAEESLQDVVSAVVRLSAEIPPHARTASTLGGRRQGNGVVIDDSGLVLTIGYLILEAASVTVQSSGGQPVSADVIAYDHESGFGLVRATAELGATPIRLGDSDALEPQERVLVISYGGLAGVRGAIVASRRAFAGYWEYLLEDAIFTIPPHPDWGGAALVGSDGKLLGIGSLVVEDAAGDERDLPGNMFVPIGLLTPILADLLMTGRRDGPRRPWLGMFTTNVAAGVLVTRVAPDGPAQLAGVAPGDIVVGIAGEPVSRVVDLYRKLWSRGEAGSEVPLDLRRGSMTLEVTVTSGDRERYLRLQPSD